MALPSTTDNGDGTITFTYDDGTTSTVNIEDADSDSTNELQNFVTFQRYTFFNKWK